MRALALVLVLAVAGCMQPEGQAAPPLPDHAVDWDLPFCTEGGLVDFSYRFASTQSSDAERMRIELMGPKGWGNNVWTTENQTDIVVHAHCTVSQAFSVVLSGPEVGAVGETIDVQATFGFAGIPSGEPTVDWTVVNPSLQPFSDVTVLPNRISFVPNHKGTWLVVAQAQHDGRSARAELRIEVSPVTSPGCEKEAETGDTTAPVLLNVTLGSAEITAGASGQYTLRVSDCNPVKGTVYVTPVGANSPQYESLACNGQFCDGGVLVGSIEIPASAPRGQWHVSMLVVSDEALNRNWAYGGDDFPEVLFTVVSP